MVEVNISIRSIYQTLNNSNNLQKSFLYFALMNCCVNEVGFGNFKQHKLSKRSAY